MTSKNAVPESAHGNCVRVRSVRKVGQADVYNMEVDEAHNFAIQGGLIVHNCLESLRYGLMSRPSPKTIRPVPQMVGNLYIDPFNQRRTQPRSTNFYDLK